MKFELFYKFKHCSGDAVYSSGIVLTEEEAKKWVKQNFKETTDTITCKDIISEECKAEFCPMKDQKPFFFYKKIDNGSQ